MKSNFLSPEMNHHKIEQEQLYLHPHHNDDVDNLQPSIHHFLEDDSSDNNSPDDPPNQNPQITILPSPQSNYHPAPDPHVSSQFYTFTRDSHALMIRCILDHRLPTADEIRAATPRHVLDSWRSVWKDRNEATAYLTAWKRIQDKLSARRYEIGAEIGYANGDFNEIGYGNGYLFFKNNNQQFVSHVGMWYDIIASFHGDTDLKHLGLRDTIDRIKQHWTVGAKFYGIPESYIRVCVSACQVCTRASSSGGGVGSKRRKFEYTESFDVPAREVQQRLLELAAKYKVVLCIRQKYIRYKPFMAEVKDYACHRAGEPAAKKSKMLKREPYASKRCGCGFRIRAIVPITNYNDKDKSFVYQEEGLAVFKLYAVHSGHEPGPLDGNARIMHRVLGHKGSIFMDHDVVYGVSEDLETDGFQLMSIEEGEYQFSVMQQVQELKLEVGLLEGRIGKISLEQLASVSKDLFDVVNKIKTIGEDSSNSKSIGLLCDKTHPDNVLIGESSLAHWSDDHHHHGRIFGDGKDSELIEDDEDSFGHTLDEVAHWDQIRTECSRGHKDLLSDSCKTEKWLKCGDFDEKGILDCEENSKLTKQLNLSHDDDTIVMDVGLVGIPVDSFYPENPKWYDSPCGLDSDGFRHGEIV